MWQEKPLNGRTVAVTQRDAAPPMAGQQASSTHNSFVVSRLQTLLRTILSMRLSAPGVDLG
jgi:hypothetical protein